MKNSQVRTVSSQINHSLSLIERVVLYNMSLYNNVEDKINYLENFYGDLIREVFVHKNYIIETFKYRYAGKIIVESKKDVKEKIYEFHSFIKRAIKFDYITEQTPNAVSAKLGINTGKQTAATGPQVKPLNLAQTPISSTKVLAKIGWDKFFSTLKDSLNSVIWGVSTEVVSFLFPALAAGVKIAGSIGWAVLFIWDLYKDNIGEALIDFFLGLCQFLPSVLGDKADELIELGKKWAGRGVKSVDILISQVLEQLGLKEILAKVWETVLQGINKFLGVLKGAAEWIEKQFNNDYTFFSQMLTKCQQFVETCRKALEKFIKEGLENAKNKVKSVGGAINKVASNTTTYTYDVGKI